MFFTKTPGACFIYRKQEICFNLPQQTLEILKSRASIGRSYPFWDEYEIGQQRNEILVVLAQLARQAWLALVKLVID
jgi:hypothetical protein